MEALTILLLCGAGLVLLIAYLIYRIGTYRKKVRIVDSANEILHLNKDPKTPERRERGHILDTPTIPEGEVLIILHKGNKKPWLKAVKDRLKEGRRIIVVTVRDPSQLRSSFRGDSHFIWLDRSTAHETRNDVAVVNPTNLSRLLQEIVVSVKGGGVVLLNGFEEILNSNETSRVVRFLRMLDESCSREGFSAIVPATYKAVPQRIRVQLTEGFETVVI